MESFIALKQHWESLDLQELDEAGLVVMVIVFTVCRSVEVM